MNESAESRDDAIQELTLLETIQRVRLDYAARFDERDLDGLVRLFAPNAVCDMSERHDEDWLGVEAIRRGYTQVFEELPTPFATLHIVTNPLVEVLSQGRARGRWYVQVYLTQQDAGSRPTPEESNSPLFFLGVYEDDYVLHDGRWKFSRVHHPALWPQRTKRPIR